MTPIHELQLSEALDLHPQKTLNYMAEWFAHEAANLTEDQLADEKQITRTANCRAWAAYLAAGIKALTSTPQAPENTPAPTISQCFSGDKILAQDHPDEKDLREWTAYLTQKLYCPHCLANSKNLTRAGATIVMRDEHPEFTEDEMAQEMQCQNCARSFYLHEGDTPIRPSRLAELLTQLRNCNGTITISSGVLTFADGTSHNLDFIS